MARKVRYCSRRFFKEEVTYVYMEASPDMEALGQRVGVAALIITVGLAGIGGTSTTAASQQRDAPVKVTFFASPDPIITNLNTNWYTKYVEKKVQHADHVGDRAG